MPAPAAAGELAADVRSGRRSAVEVIAEHRDRAHAAADLNAFITSDWDSAIDRAAELDRLRRSGEQLGPLAGVPLSVKDVIAVAGLPATLGSRAFARNRAEATATAVQRLTDAGAIVVGKTNLPEFAFGTTSDNELVGATLNPLDPSRSPGGSSGGEAASVAAGVSALGLGTDYGGSLRWPAACTGIVALRPTAQRVPDDGVLPGAGGDVSGRTRPDPFRMQSRYQVVGPLARTVADLVFAFDVLCPDADAAPPPSAPRIGWTAGTELGPVRAELIAALSAAAAALGATEVPTGLADALQAYNAYRDVDPLTDHLEAVHGREDLVSPGALASLVASTAAGASERAAARERADAVRATALGVFDHVDVLLLPVAGGPACVPDGSVDVDGTVVSGWQLMNHCRAVTLLGTPSVSVPVGLSAEGLPLSIQVVAAPGRDRTALAVAGML